MNHNPPHTDGRYQASYTLIGILVNETYVLSLTAGMSSGDT